MITFYHGIKTIHQRWNFKYQIKRAYDGKRCYKIPFLNTKLLQILNPTFLNTSHIFTYFSLSKKLHGVSSRKFSMTHILNAIKFLFKIQLCKIKINVIIGGNFLQKIRIQTHAKTSKVFYIRYYLYNENNFIRITHRILKGFFFFNFNLKLCGKNLKAIQNKIIF